jgi:hypothetical protein
VDVKFHILVHISAALNRGKHVPGSHWKRGRVEPKTDYNDGWVQEQIVRYGAEKILVPIGIRTPIPLYAEYALLAPATKGVFSSIIRACSALPYHRKVIECQYHGQVHTSLFPPVIFSFQ